MPPQPTAFTACEGVSFPAEAAVPLTAQVAEVCRWLSASGLPVACGAGASGAAGAAIGSDCRGDAGALVQLNLTPAADASGGAPCVALALRPEALARWAPGFDTLALAHRLSPKATCADANADADADALGAETLVAMLAAPQRLAFASMAEWQANVAMRGHIVRAAARTALAFSTSAAERPAHYWRDGGADGFLLRPHRCLIEALRAATQPAVTGRRYDFSCYRATEYVILLGIAQEAAERHPALLHALAAASRERAIRSAQFHAVFLREHGSAACPLPPRYYIPGDRVWFRNPDEASADVAGYEGSWVIYLGGGRFANFWKHEQPFDFEGKCIEIYHWRHAVRPGPDGAPTIDEDEVARRVAATRADPAACAAVLSRMQRLADGRGVYADGGCIDRTREYPRAICPGTADIALPGFSGAASARA